MIFRSSIFTDCPGPVPPVCSLHCRLQFTSGLQSAVFVFTDRLEAYTAARLCSASLGEFSQISGNTIKCTRPCPPSVSKETRSWPVHQNDETLDLPCKRHCEEAGSPHSRMYQAFPSLLQCNDDLHSDSRTRGLFGRNWFEFLSAVYLRPRARTTLRICLHFSSMPYCVEREKEPQAQDVCTTKRLSGTVHILLSFEQLLSAVSSESKSTARMFPISHEYQRLYTDARARGSLRIICCIICFYFPVNPFIRWPKRANTNKKRKRIQKRAHHQTKAENANKEEHITKQKKNTQTKKNTSPKKKRKRKQN